MNDSGATGLLRVGLVGLGAWGERLLATLQTLPNVVIAWVAPGRSPEALERCPTGLELAPDWRVAMAQGSADAVVIATPPNSHAEIALAALAHGLPVFIEKPLALDAAEAYAVIARAEAQGLPLLVDHIHLFSPAYQWLKAALPERPRLRGIRAEAGNNGPWRRDYGVLFDWGPHDLALAIDVFGPELALTSAVYLSREQRGEGGHAEALELQLVTSSGQPIVLRLSNCLPEKRRSLRILGAEADYCYTQGHTAATAQIVPLGSGRGVVTEHTPGPTPSPLGNALTAFLDAVRVGQAPPEWNLLARSVTRLLAEAEQRLRA